jgi:hypothetical protein
VVGSAPGLVGRLGAGERVVHVSVPAGSGKTFLLRSWIAAVGLGDRAASVSVGRGERDGQAFWLSVLESLRGTPIGSGRVRELTAAPGLDGATVVRRLVEDLGSLDERVRLVLDDLHERPLGDKSIHAGVTSRSRSRVRFRTARATQSPHRAVAAPSLNRSHLDRRPGSEGDGRRDASSLAGAGCRQGSAGRPRQATGAVRSAC